MKASSMRSDVETVLEFAEHVVLNARRLWSEFPLQHRRRMQMVLFPEGLVYDGEASRTPVTCLFFSDSERPEIELERVVAQTIPSWNQIEVWLRDLNTFREPVEQLTTRWVQGSDYC